MARMSDSEVLAYADKICKMAVADSPARRAEYCANKGRTPNGKYCEASSHTTCARCRWFTPTIMAKIRVLVEGNLNLKDERDNMDKKIGRMGEELAIAKETISYYRQESIDPDLKARQAKLADEMRQALVGNGQLVDGDELRQDAMKRWLELEESSNGKQRDDREEPETNTTGKADVEEQTVAVD